MIELISQDRCTGCNVCVRACPNDVFAARPDQAPAIARPADCHTCFLCELYCPVDAIYVAPHDPATPRPEETHVIQWGSYARASGWTKGRPQLAKAEARHA
ncbi:ferredoxin [Pigmentiphaga humi]|uniref:Ferredoxin n=1 Tax=Pigmentiphaga humi TaxID=2478468 RepID=A0A3P4AZA1_9BURK|nr:ferredoxin family protein [Pigmentiphaga humi]VCU69363.1 ferredoxin [Pigmentiphaga humi]